MTNWRKNQHKVLACHVPPERFHWTLLLILQVSGTQLERLSTIFLKDIPSLRILSPASNHFWWSSYMLGVESIGSHMSPKTLIGVQLGWDVTGKAMAYDSHHFYTRWTAHWPLVTCSWIDCYPGIYIRREEFHHGKRTHSNCLSKGTSGPKPF